MVTAVAPNSLRRVLALLMTGLSPCTLVSSPQSKTCMVRLPLGVNVRVNGVCVSPVTD